MTTTPAPRDERKPVILGYGMWNTGTNPQTSLMRYDGMPIVHTEPRVGTVALVSIDDYNAEYERAALAESELAEVRAENLRLAEMNNRLANEGITLTDQRDELRAELERVKSDARRYRWLRSSAWYVGPEPDGDLQGVSWADNNCEIDSLDFAIDAAIGAGEGDAPETHPISKVMADNGDTIAANATIAQQAEYIRLLEAQRTSGFANPNTNSAGQSIARCSQSHSEAGWCGVDDCYRRNR